MKEALSEWFGMAGQAAGEHSFNLSVSAFAKANREKARDAWFWFRYGSAAGDAGNRDFLERAWRKARELEPNNGELLLQMGHQYQSMRLPSRAKALFEEASVLRPTEINPRISVAMWLERHHQLDEALDAVNSCLALDSRDEQARYFRALLHRRRNNFEVAERELRDIIASNPKHQFVRYGSRYELAHVLDRTGRFDEAMAALAEAKLLVRQLADVDEMLGAYNRTTENSLRITKSLPVNTLRVWAKQFPEKKRHKIPRLAFLGGHPRSGTTLLEQILGAHSDVVAVDEPPAFNRTVIPLFKTSRQLTSDRLNVIRRAYMNDIQSELGQKKLDAVLIDKNPSPTASLRIWLRIFPELRVIIALRDPRDVVISCYFQNIPINPINANFLSLERTALHYCNLMAIWLTVREWEDFAWIESRYEQTVANLESEGARVTQFLGLKWTQRQSEYHINTTTQQVYSPTYHDASRKVYGHSVYRWKDFERHLAPIQQMLAPYCKAFGYS